MGAAFGGNQDTHCVRKEGREEAKRKTSPSQPSAPHAPKHTLLRTTSPTRPPPSPPQAPGELLLLLLDEAEDEESGFCCATFDRSRTSHCGGRRVILFSLLKYSLHLWWMVYKCFQTKTFFVKIFFAFINVFKLSLLKSSLHL